MLSSCGFYHDYGLKIGSSKSVLHQDNEFYITDDYEFVSVLYRSEDGLLTITLQHPLHPVPEPEVFISQLAFQLDDSSCYARFCVCRVAPFYTKMLSAIFAGELGVRLPVTTLRNFLLTTKYY